MDSLAGLLRQALLIPSMDFISLDSAGHAFRCAIRIKGEVSASAFAQPHQRGRWLGTWRKRKDYTHGQTSAESGSQRFGNGRIRDEEVCGYAQKDDRAGACPRAATTAPASKKEEVVRPKIAWALLGAYAFGLVGVGGALLLALAALLL